MQCLIQRSMYCWKHASIKRLKLFCATMCNDDLMRVSNVHACMVFASKSGDDGLRNYKSCRSPALCIEEGKSLYIYIYIYTVYSQVNIYIYSGIDYIYIYIAESTYPPQRIDGALLFFSPEHGIPLRTQRCHVWPKRMEFPCGHRDVTCGQNDWSKSFKMAF